MASGPFSSRGNQAAEIPGVQLKGGFSPTPGIADAVGAIANVAIPAIKKNHIENLREDITGKTESVKTALLARANPLLAQSLFTEEALANPATAAAFRQFNDIANAVKQGRLPGQFALERLTVIQNDAIAESPEFEQEIRAAVMQATGQDPEKRIFSSLLSDQRQALSPQEKARQKVQQQAAELNLSEDAIIEGNRIAFQNGVEEAKFKSQARLGTVNFNAVSKASTRRAGAIMMDVMQQGIMQLNTGEGLTPDYIGGVKVQLNASIAAATAQIIASAGDNIDGKEMTLALAPLEKLQKQVEGLVDSASWKTLLTNRNLLNQQLIIGELQNTAPEIAAAHALGGDSGVLQVLQLMEKATNPQVRALLDSLNPNAAVRTATGELTSGVQFVPTPNGILKQYTQLGTGIAGLDVKSTNERILAANTAIQTVGGKEEVHTRAVEDLESVSPDHAWVAFDNRKVVQSALQSKVLQAKFIPLQAQQTAGLATEFFNLSALPGFRADKFELVNGELLYKQEFSPLTPQGALSELDKLAPMFVRRFNKANKISNMYSGVGVLPASRYTGVQDYFKLVTSSVKDVIDGSKDTPEEGATEMTWGRDANGNPVRIK